MCKTCEPVISCDYSEGQTIQTILSLVAAETGQKPLEQWAKRLWSTNHRAHAEKLGPTLRREICVPSKTGWELLAEYRNAIDIASSWMGYPDWLTAKDCESQKVASKRGKKLSRAIAEWLEEKHIADNSVRAAIVDQIQTSIRKSNGRKLVLSANPLDKMLASNFASYYDQTCHRWLWGGGEGKKASTRYPAGNFSYAQSAEVLVLTSHDTRLKTIHDITLPRKTWRQLVFLADDAAFLMRQYGETPNELVHNLARKMVAEYLAGADNPVWKKIHRTMSYSSEQAYSGDSTNCCIVLSDSPNSFEPESSQSELSIPNAICPICNSERDDIDLEEIACNNCSGVTDYRCCCCHDYISEDDVRSPDGGDGYYCESCYNDRFSYCESCETDCLQSDMVSVGDDYMCEDCRNTNYTECDSCNEWTPDSDISCDGNCGYCQQTINEQLEAEAEAEAEACHCVPLARRPVASCAGQLSLPIVDVEF